MANKIQVKAMFYGDFQKRVINNLIDIRGFVSLKNPPLTSNSAGSPGQIATDSSYLYVCVAESSWKRSALSSW